MKHKYDILDNFMHVMMMSHLWENQSDVTLDDDVVNRENAYLLHLLHIFSHTEFFFREDVLLERQSVPLTERKWHSNIISNTT